MADKPRPKASTRDVRLGEDTPLINTLSQFLRALDSVHNSWLTASTHKLEEAHPRAFELRNELLEVVDSNVIPPAGQTGVQFAAGLCGLVEEAWNLCRLVFAEPSDVHADDLFSQKYQKAMRERFPDIREELWKAWRHLNYVESFDKSKLAKVITIEIDQLAAETPPLDKNSALWVDNKRAAAIDGVETRTLADYRAKGIKNAERTVGRDNDGRVWRREGTPGSHPWYLRKTLCAK